jgi:hypothetical protein
VEHVGSNQHRHFRAMTPQVAGAIFAVTLAFMLLFPFVHVSLEGSGEPELLLFLAKTDFGLNIFALVLLLTPVAAIAASLTMREHSALLADAVLAIIGVLMIPLTLLTAAHDAGGDASLSSHVTPGVGLILVTIMLCVLALSAGIAAIQTRH